MQKTVMVVSCWILSAIISIPVFLLFGLLRYHKGGFIVCHLGGLHYDVSTFKFLYLNGHSTCILSERKMMYSCYL